MGSAEAMAMWWTWWLGAAPDVDLRPVVAASGVESRYSAHRREQGLPPEELACAPLWPGAAELCFRVWERGQRRWVTATDATRWGTTAHELVRVLSDAAGAKLATAELLPVDGLDARYLRLVDGDGWAAAGALRPELLAQRLGGLPVHVAMPADSVLIAWRAGDAELERVMAVGVREWFDQTAGRVSPKVHEWDGLEWRPYGEAQPRP
jgi:hypothetical protein